LGRKLSQFFGRPGKLKFSQGNQYIDKLLMINILVPLGNSKGIIAIIAIIDY
jgi:hypothetical protein